MLLHSLVMQSTYSVILCLPCASLKSFLRREKTFSPKKFYVILKIIPSAIYIRSFVEFWIMTDFPRRNIFEMRSERKCSIFDLLWPDPSILEGESEKFLKIKPYLMKKIRSLSCLTRVYLCAKIETIWIFDPCHENVIFVWFLHGCTLNCSYQTRRQSHSFPFTRY